MNLLSWVPSNYISAFRKPLHICKEFNKNVSLAILMLMMHHTRLRNGAPELMWGKTKHLCDQSKKEHILGLEPYLHCLPDGRQHGALEPPDLE